MNTPLEHLVGPGLLLFLTLLACYFFARVLQEAKAKRKTCATTPTHPFDKLKHPSSPRILFAIGLLCGFLGGASLTGVRLLRYQIHVANAGGFPVVTTTDRLTGESSSRMLRPARPD